MPDIHIDDGTHTGIDADAFRFSSGRRTTGNHTAIRDSVIFPRWIFSELISFAARHTPCYFTRLGDEDTWGRDESGAEEDVQPFLRFARRFWSWDAMPFVGNHRESHRDQFVYNKTLAFSQAAPVEPLRGESQGLQLNTGEYIIPQADSVSLLRGDVYPSVSALEDESTELGWFHIFTSDDTVKSKTNKIADVQSGVNDSYGFRRLFWGTIPPKEPTPEPRNLTVFARIWQSLHDFMFPTASPADVTTPPPNQKINKGRQEIFAPLRWLRVAWEWVVALLLKIITFMSGCLDTGRVELYNLCGRPCQFLYTLYEWRNAFSYIISLSFLYLVYLAFTLFIEEILLPCCRNCRQLKRFLQGTSPRLALRIAMGGGVGYEDRWHGPLTGNPYSIEQLDDIKVERDPRGQPFDLICTQDQVGFIRLRGSKGAKQGKSDRHGGFFKFDQVVSCNDNALYEAVIASGKRVHLCSGSPCGDRSGKSGVHIRAWSMIPRESDLDMNELLTPPWYLRLLLFFSSFAQKLAICCHRCTLSVCRQCLRNCIRSTPLPVKVEPDEAVTSSEDDERLCNAHLVCLKCSGNGVSVFPGSSKKMPFTKTPCTEPAERTVIRLLSDDAKVSAKTLDQNEEGHTVFYGCPSHASLYSKRVLTNKCAIAACFNIGTVLKMGHLYCPIHSADKTNADGSLSRDLEAAPKTPARSAASRSVSPAGVRQRSVVKTLYDAPPFASDERNRKTPAKDRESSRDSRRSAKTSKSVEDSYGEAFARYLASIALHGDDALALQEAATAELPPTELAPHFLTHAKPLWSKYKLIPLGVRSGDLYGSLEGESTLFHEEAAKIEAVRQSMRRLTRSKPAWPSEWTKDCGDYLDLADDEAENDFPAPPVPPPPSPPPSLAPPPPLEERMREICKVGPESVYYFPDTNLLPSGEPSGFLESGGVSKVQDEHMPYLPNPLQPSFTRGISPFSSTSPRPVSPAIPIPGVLVDHAGRSLFGSPSMPTLPNTSGNPGVRYPRESNTYSIANLNIPKPGHRKGETKVGGIHTLETPSHKVGSIIDPPDMPPVADQPGMTEVLKEMMSELKGTDKAALSAEAGSLKSVTKQHDRFLLYLRGAGSYEVVLCPNVFGADLIKAMRHEQCFNFHEWYRSRKQYFLTDRLCYAGATVSIGGMTLREVPNHCITPSEFPRLTAVDLDKKREKELVDSYNYKREKPPPRTYFQNPVMFKDYVDREIAFYADLWGREWYPEMSDCIIALLAFHEEHPNIWRIDIIQDVWEELKMRLRIELAHFDNIVLGYCKGDKSPGMDRVRWTCSIVKEDGLPLLRPAEVFDLNSPTAYFQTVYLPRLERRYMASTWASVLNPIGGRKKVGSQGKCDQCGRRSHEGPCRTNGGSDTGGSASERSSRSSRGNSSFTSSAASSAPTSEDEAKLGAKTKLKLNRGERERLKKHDIKHHNKSVCLAHNSHAQCNNKNCTKAHVIKDFNSLDYSAKLYLYTKQGHTKQKKLSKEEAAAAISALRAQVRLENEQKRNDGKRPRTPSPKPKAQPQKKKKSKKKKDTRKVGFSDSESVITDNASEYASSVSVTAESAPEREGAQTGKVPEHAKSSGLDTTLASAGEPCGFPACEDQEVFETVPGSILPSLPESFASDGVLPQPDFRDTFIKLSKRDPPFRNAFLRYKGYGLKTQYLKHCLYEDGDSDKGAAERKLLWDAMNPDTRKAFGCVGSETLDEIDNRFHAIEQEEKDLAKMLERPSKRLSWQWPHWKVGQEAPIVGVDVLSSDGTNIHPQLAVHLPGYEPPERTLAEAQRSPSWHKNIHFAEHVVPNPPLDLFSAEAEWAQLVSNTLQGYVEEPPQNTAWGNAELLKFLTTPRFKTWLFQSLAKHADFKADPSSHLPLITEALENALSLGDFELNDHAARVLDELIPRSRSHPGRKLGATQAYSSRLRALGDDLPKGGVFKWEINGAERVWERLDYGESIPVSEHRTRLLLLQGDSPTPLDQNQTETCQCFVYHLAAAKLYAHSRQVPAVTSVQRLAARILDELADQAVAAQEVLGPPGNRLTQAECDIYGMIHDLLHPHHTKDYRTTALFPVAEFQQYALCFIRIDTHFRASLDVVIGDAFKQRADHCLWFHVKDAHLTLCKPPLPTMFFPCGVLVPAVGWQSHLEASEETPATYSMPPCGICHAQQDDAQTIYRTGYETGAICAGTLRNAPATVVPQLEVDGTASDFCEHLAARQTFLAVSSSQAPILLLTPYLLAEADSHDSVTVFSYMHAWLANPDLAPKIMNELLRKPHLAIILELPTFADRTPFHETSSYLRCATWLKNHLLDSSDCTVPVLVGSLPEAAFLHRLGLPKEQPGLWCRSSGPAMGPAGLSSSRNWSWFLSHSQLKASVAECKSVASLLNMVASHQLKNAIDEGGGGGKTTSMRRQEALHLG